MGVPLPVAKLITLLSTGAITVRRRMASPSVNALGERVAGDYVDTVVSPAVVHPASEAKLELLPVTNRAIEHVEVYTKTAIKTAQGSFAADEVYWSGAWYKVVAVSDYDTQGAVYFALAERMRSS